MDISIIQLLWNPFQGLVDWFKGIFDGILGSFFSIFTTPIAFLLYSLQVGFFMLIDCIQQVFRSIAGLEGGQYWRDGTPRQNEDIVYDMLYNKTVWDVFLSVLFVSLILLFIVAIVAIIRQEFTEQGAGNSKTKIIGRAIKSLVYFAVVPIVCVMGIFISNVFLQTFDKATRRGAVRLSTQVFSAAATEANRARINENIAKNMFEDGKLVRALFYNDGNTAKDGNGKDVRWNYFENNITEVTVHSSNGVDSWTIARGDSTTQDFVADIIDAAFRLDAFGNNISEDGDEIHISTNWQSYEFCAFLLNGFSADLHNDTFDVKNVQFVHYFYDIFWGYSYIIGFVGGFTAAMLLLTTCLGLIQRIYELLILFMIAPAFIAFMPMDDGAKYNQWRGQFVSRVGMAYGPVIGMNLMFIVLEVVQTIDIFEPGNPFNAIMQMIFMIVGLLGVKEFSNMISNLLGQTDALNVGSSKKGDVQKMAGRIAGGSVAAAKMGQAGLKATGNTLRGLSVDKVDYNRLKRQKGQREEMESLAKQMKDASAKGDWATARAAQAKYNSLGGTSELRKLQASSAADDAKLAKMQSKLEKAQDKGWGGQINKALQGSGHKTEFFGAYGNFLKSAGPDVGYFSRAAIAKRAESGESGLAQLNMWADGGSGKTLGETLGNMAFGKKGDDGKRNWTSARHDLGLANKNNSDAKAAKDAADAKNADLNIEQKRNDAQIAKQLGLKPDKDGNFSAADQAKIEAAKNVAIGGTAGSIGTLNVQNLNLDKALVKGDGSTSSAAGGAGGAGGSGGTSTIKTDGDALNVTGDVGIKDGTQVGITSDSFEPLKEKLENIANEIGTDLSAVALAIKSEEKQVKSIAESLSGTYKPGPGGKTPPPGYS